MKHRYLRYIALAAACTLTPMLNSCMLEELGGNASEFSPSISSHISTIKQVMSNGNSRGYITAAEAQAMITSLKACAEEVDLMTHNAGVAGHNAKVYGSSPYYMNNSQRRLNSIASIFLRMEERNATQKAEALKQDVLSAVSWLKEMSEAGRIQ